MASKNKSKTKVLGTDPSLGKMAQRMITTMLREERIAERDLQEKLKTISQKEHKAMVKIGCDSLDVRHDLTLYRSSSLFSGEHKENLTTGESGDGEKGSSPSGFEDHLSRPKLGRAVSMLTYQSKKETTTQSTEPVKRTNSEDVKSLYKPIPNNPAIRIDNECLFQGKEDKNNQHNSSQTDNLSNNCKGKSELSSQVDPSPSPRLLRRRPVSDITSTSVLQVSHEGEEILVAQISLPRVCSNMRLAPTPPSTPPPQRRHLNPITPDVIKQRPSSARSARSKTPVKEIESLKLDRPQIRQNRSPSPSRTHLLLDPSKINIGRRGSAPPKIDAAALPATSPLRKALGSNDVLQGLRPTSPDVLRKRLSSNEEELKDRVSMFLRSLEKT